MTKMSVRVLLLSCVMVPILAVPVAQAQTQPSATGQPTTAAGDMMSAVNAANAAAAYTGNASLAQQAAQPGQAMTPNNMQTGPFPSSQPAPTLRYNKKEAEGSFYGVETPKRLFNNVPSDW